MFFRTDPDYCKFHIYALTSLGGLERRAVSQESNANRGYVRGRARVYISDWFRRKIPHSTKICLKVTTRGTNEMDVLQPLAGLVHR